MGKILGGRCQCGYTCSGLIFGENNHNFDIAICYQCKELYSVELPVSSLGKESASVDVIAKMDDKLNACPLCRQMGVTAAVVPYHSKDSGNRAKKSIIKTLFAKLSDSFKELEFVGYCPQCGKHRLHLYTEGGWD
jgi:hypothetical protein